MVEIYAASRERLQDLQRVFEIDVVRSTARQMESGFAVEALVFESEIETLRGDGFQVEILGDAEELGRQRQRELG
jgi:hypothetical protein